MPISYSGPSFSGDWANVIAALKDAPECDAKNQLLGRGTGDISPVRKQTVLMRACALTPAVSSGCATLSTMATSSGHPDMQFLAFDSVSSEYAQFDLRMPNKWDRGAFNYSVVWSHASTATNFGVAWQLEAVAVPDGSTQDVAFGTGIIQGDTGGTTNAAYLSAESSTVTAAGSISSLCNVNFRIGRIPADAGDTLAVDARLQSLSVYYRTSSGSDD